MSTGTTKPPESEQRAEFKKNATVEIAKQWCLDCRRILGLGFFSDGGRMDDAIKGAATGLENLEPYVAFDTRLADLMKTYTQEFGGIAFDLDVLRREYKDFENQAKVAKSGTSERKNAEANAKKKYREIVAKISELETLEKKIKTEITQKEDEIKKSNEIIRNLPDGKKILQTRQEFGKKLAILRKYHAQFVKNFDAEAANSIERKLNEFCSYDWTKARFLTDAVEKLNQIKAEILRIEQSKLAYKEGKSKYESVKDEYAIKIALAEQVLPVSSLETQLAIYSNGQQAVNEKNWIQAGLNINRDNLTKLNNLLTPAQNNYEIWKKLVEGDFATTKTSLEKLLPKEYQIVGLSQLANAFAFGEKTRDYTSAVQMLNEVLNAIPEIMEASKVYVEKLRQLRIQRDKLNVVVLNVKGDAQILATPYTDKLYEVVNGFTDSVVTKPFTKNDVPSPGMIESEYENAKNEFDKIEVALSELGNEDQVKILLEKQRVSKSIKPLIDLLQRKFEETQLKTYNYIGMRMDPLNDKGLADKWNIVFAQVANWVKARNEDLKTKKETNYSTEEVEQKRLLSELDKIDLEVTGIITTAESTVSGLQTTLAKACDELKTLLGKSRLTTVREENWHANATLELADFRMLCSTDNKKAIEDALTRIEKLKKQCSNVITDTINNIAIPQDHFIQYNYLKETLESLLKRLRDKDLVATMRRGCEIYGGKQGLVAVMLQDIRNDGAGAMDDIRDDGKGSKDVAFKVWKGEVDKLSSKIQEDIFDKYTALVDSKKQCTNKIKLTRERIMGELCRKIKEVSGKTVSGKNLALHGQLTEIEGNMMTADSKERFDQISRQLDELNKEIGWAIEDTTNNLFKPFLDQDSEGEKLQQQVQSENSRLRGQYEIALSEFEKAREIAEKSDELDEVEFKRYVDLSKTATSAFKKNNLAEAAKRMQLASRMMKALAKNPKGSQVTGRGIENLKNLNTRWQNGITTLDKSLQNLSAAILASCVEATDEPKETQGTAIQSKFDSTVMKSVISQFDAKAFERGLLILQLEPPKDKVAKEKDLANKKKYREMLLSLSREYSSTIKDDPVNSSLFFKPNPWQNENGFVNAVELMRAINDINLNVERGVG